MTQSSPWHVALAVPCMAVCSLWAQVSPPIQIYIYSHECHSSMPGCSCSSSPGVKMSAQNAHTSKNVHIRPIQATRSELCDIA